MVQSGPIPGANFTSDTKSYPWHQPPEFTNPNKALDWVADKITDFKVANSMLTFVEMGAPVYKVASMLLMQGVAEGKWTVDLALMLAGPVTRMIELICITFEVEYDLGIEDDPNDFETGTFFENLHKAETPAGMDLLDTDPGVKEEDAGDAAPPTDDSGGLNKGGFMAMKKGE